MALQEERSTSMIALLVDYLRQSHVYYLDTALVKIENDLRELMEPCPEKSREVVWKFFTEFKTEMQRHFVFEEEQIFPYASDLLADKDSKSLKFNEEEHSNIDEKLDDLVRIVRDYLPDADPARKESLLSYLAFLHKDLLCHTSAEDDVLLPMLQSVGRQRRLAAAKDALRSRASEALTAREKEILVSVARGKINKEIADEHNISIHTVISHRKNISAKTGIKTVAGLTAYAILNDLLDIRSIE